MIARLKLPLDLQWCPKCGAPCLDDPDVTDFTHDFNRIGYAVKLRCANGHESEVFLTIDAIRTAHSRVVI